MTKNGKETSQKSENGYRKKKNGSLYLLMEESNKYDKSNGEWQERKEQPTMVRTRAKNGHKEVGGSSR